MTLNELERRNDRRRKLSLRQLIASWFSAKTLKQNYTLQHAAHLVGG